MKYFYKNDLLNSHLPARNSLLAVNGIGRARASFICSLLGISHFWKLEQISPFYFNSIVYLLNKYYQTGAKLKRIRENTQKKLLLQKSYAALKYSSGLPIRGQRTRTNAKTSRRNFSKIKR